MYIDERRSNICPEQARPSACCSQSKGTNKHARDAALLKASDFPPIRRRRLETLQVNLGYRCNQACLHAMSMPAPPAPSR